MSGRDMGASPSGDRAAGPADLSRASASSLSSIPSALFSYTSDQNFNIHLRLHPDCCQSEVCAFCGASEANGLACHGELDGLALELFEEARCSAHNANIQSIGQFINWRTHDRHARAFDAAARFIAASAMSAGTAETAQQAQGQSPASAAPERGDAQ